MHNKLYSPLINRMETGLQIKRIWEVRADTSYYVRWNGIYPHNGMIILRTLSGSGLVELKKKKRLICQPQSFVLLNPSTINSYRTREPLWSFVWFELVGRSFFEIAIGKIFSVPLLDHEIPILAKSLDSIGKDELSDMIGQNGICRLLLDWALKVKESEKEIKYIENRAEKIARLMSKTANNPLSVFELSKHAGLCLSRFRQVFKAEFSMSPKKYYTHIRMAKAMSWLRNSNMKLSEISERLSYSSQYHLSREFKKYFGSPPSKFRPN